MAKNPFLELQNLSSELWNTQKGIAWQSTPKAKEQYIKRCEKIIGKIRELDFDKEIEFLRYFNNIKQFKK